MQRDMLFRFAVSESSTCACWLAKSSAKVSNIQAATLYCERCKTDFHFISLNKKEIDLVEYT